MYQVSWGNCLTVMLKWSEGYEWDNKIQMQNLLNMLRINELEATYPLESRRKKKRFPRFSQDRYSPYPVLCSPPAERELYYSAGEGLKATAPPLTRGWHGPALNSPLAQARQRSP